MEYLLIFSRAAMFGFAGFIATRHTFDYTTAATIAAVVVGILITLVTALIGPSKFTVSTRSYRFEVRDRDPR